MRCTCAPEHLRALPLRLPTADASRPCCSPCFCPLQIVAITVGSGSTTASVINARTGAVQQTLSAAGAAADLLHLPQPVHDNSADQHVFVLVPAGGAGAAVQLLPDTPQARAAFEAARPSFSFWRVDKQAGTVSGLGFAGGGWGHAWHLRTLAVSLP